MIIGRILLAFITALSRVFPGVKSPKQVDAESGMRGGASTAAKPAVAPPQSRPSVQKTTPESLPDGSTHSTDLTKIHGVFGYGKELFTRFTGDQCPAWAASLSFFSIISLPSVLLCGLAVLGFVVQSPKVAERYVEKALTQVLPGQTKATAAATPGATEKQPTAASKATARGIIQDMNIAQSVEEIRKRRGWTAVVGVALLLWSAIQIFVNASTPINAAFGVKETRNFFQVRLVALGLLFSTGILFVLSLLPAAGVQVLNSLKLFGSYPDPTPFWLDAIFWAVGIAINAVLFTVIYRFLPSPSAKVSWQDARFGGVIAAVLWEIAKQGFALYLQRLGGAASYDKLYGSLGSIFLLVFWIYYTSMILLLGAEIAKLYGDLREAKAGQVPAKI
ncbi:MAG: YihY/virulence factor BrkB family protein [Akkermansiaceae bacterium]|nr:YihY/virulence factor BrkB family protein [Armatimonadota bacterium]